MKLSFTDAKGRAKTFPLTTKTVIVGRSTEADLVVDNEKVSRMHFTLVLEEGTYFVKDLKSRNGTFLNGREIQHEPIRAGDKIRAGGITFFVDDEAEMGPTTAINLVEEEMQGGKGYHTIMRGIVEETNTRRRP